MPTNSIRPKRERHGQAGRATPEYRAWKAMIQRCSNSKLYGYHCYGGRGIKVCEAWAKSFLRFWEHVGDRPSAEHSLDRYPDKNGDYEPGNVRWATQKQQCGNLRKNVWLSAFGVRLIQSDWAKLIGTSKVAIGRWLRRNQSKNLEDFIAQFIPRRRL